MHIPIKTNINPLKTLKTMVHNFYFYSETGQIILGHDLGKYPGSRTNLDSFKITDNSLITKAKDTFAYFMDPDLDEEILNDSIYAFSILEIYLVPWALKIISDISTELSRWADDDQYFDDNPDLVQQLWIILKQWPEDLTGHNAYILLSNFYNSLEHLWDKDEDHTNDLDYRFSTYYNTLN